MTKVNLNKGNETKSDFFPWEIFNEKCPNLSVFILIYKILQHLNDF